jgi:poly-gamma-glutamate synthesis protein (capsule biosynthesis protein)
MMKHIGIKNVLLTVLTVGLLLQGCSAAGKTRAAIKIVPMPAADSAASQAVSSAAPDADTTVSFLAAGDNVLHEAVYKDTLTASGGYDFSPIYQSIAPEVQKSDFAFINQEGPLGGTSLGLEGYPLFNAPQEAGTALVRTGFNLISQANNHALDFGFNAIASTCTFWKSQSGVVMAGMNANADDYGSIPVLTKKGVKIAFIAYTWSLNGIAYPAGKQWCVQTDFNDVLDKVRRARTMADVVVVSVHWGDEYQNQINSEQKSQAKQLADAGADIIIGNHPHVIQNIEWLSAADGRKALCAYAMGNFISSQGYFENVIGGMLELNITKSGSGITLQNVRFVPIITFYVPGFKNFRVYLLSDFTAQLAAQHGLAYKDDLSQAHIKQYVKGIISPEFYSG